MTILIDSPILNIMSNALRKASKPITRDFGEILHLQSSFKGTDEFARKTYQRVSEIISEELFNSRSDFDICNLGDQNIETGSDYRWVIDPIEGIKNFSHGLPYFSSIIILQKMNNTGNYDTIAAALEAPGLEESQYVHLGMGAWSENYSRFSKGMIRMRVSLRKNQQDTLIISDCLQMQRNYLGVELLTASLLASGKIDALILKSFNETKKAAAKLFVSEAGGVFVDHSNYFILGNNALKAQLKEV